MGTLVYDSDALEVQLEDRVLAHLQIVIINKLKRGERFAFSWKDDPAVGDGRTTIWMFPDLPLRFKFSGGRPPRINRTWLDELFASAASGSGLVLTPEPAEREDDSDILVEDMPGMR